MIHQLNILVVEDSPTQAMQLVALLSGHGAIVKVATNGHEALELLKTFQPLIIISDIVMPGMNGYELCASLKADERYKSIPVILVTELSEPNDVIRGMSCGADNFMIKPYDEVYLLNRIRYFMVNLQLRMHEKVQMGIEIQLDGQRHVITADRQQMLDLLISTYEQGIRLNTELRLKHEMLMQSNHLLHSLFHFSRAIAESESEHSLISTAMQHIAEFNHVSGVWLVLADNESADENAYIAGKAGHLPNHLSICPESVELIGLAREQFDNIGFVPKACPALHEHHSDEHQIYPLFLGSQSIGSLCVIHEGKESQPGEWRQMMQSVAHHLAVALSKVRLLTSLDTLVKSRTRELSENQQLLSRILETLPVGVFVADTQGRVVLANAAGEKLWQQCDLPALSDVSTPVTTVPDNWPLHRSMRKGITIVDELVEAATENDAALVLMSSSAPLLDEQQQVNGGVAIIQDVSERTRLLRELTLRDRALESSVNGVIITDHLDQNEPIVYVNRAFEHITGYSRMDVLGKNCRFLQGVDTQQTERESIRFALQNHQPVECVLRNYRKDGSMFHAELRLAPVANSHGEVTHYIGVVTDISERLRYQNELERKSNYDELTGLLNKNLLIDRMKQQLAISAVNKSMFVLAFIDVDDFKLINEKFSHDIGDHVLVHVAQLIRHNLRPSDSAARLGADSYVVLLPELNSVDEALARLAQIRDSCIKSLSIPDGDIKLGVSIGFALYPDDGANVDTLLRSADLALADIKRQQKRGIGAFKKEMNARVKKRLEFEKHIHQAIRSNELRLYFQPQISLRTGEIIGFEALIRWQRGDELIFPNDFIPLAEEFGLIVEIDRWVVVNGIKALSDWQKLSTVARFLSINLSSHSFHNDQIVEVIRQALLTHQVSARQIKVEVTESLLIGDSTKALEIMQALKAMGVQLSLDDFGTGYSSMSYLQLFPFDQIKIDQSFVKDIYRDAANATLSRSVIAIAHNLSMNVLAEGVETAEQLSYLANNDCDAVQGYFFSKPVPFEKATLMLNQANIYKVQYPDIAEMARSVLVYSRRHEILQPVHWELKQLNYDMRLVRHGDDMLPELARQRIGVLLVDIDTDPDNMVTIFRQLRAIHPLSMRIAICSAGQYALAMELVESGLANRYVQMPTHSVSLRHYLKEATFLYKIGLENERMRRQFETKKIENGAVPSA